MTIDEVKAMLAPGVEQHRGFGYRIGPSGVIITGHDELPAPVSDVEIRADAITKLLGLTS